MPDRFCGNMNIMDDVHLFTSHYYPLFPMLSLSPHGPYSREVDGVSMIIEHMATIAKTYSGTHSMFAIDIRKY